MSISDVVSTSNNVMNGSKAKIKSTNKMGKNEFLELMVTQLKNQDPLDPMDNKEFISQTAQFTSLEQMSNMNTNMEEFLNMQKLTQVSGLVGKEVKALNEDSGETITGEVEKVKMADSGPKLIINGNEYNMGSVNEILG
ncbi:flagellar hook capping FlgD N-terminal domain-containing protein [Sporohalobacter salinus]|uniref:flagellar hook capping FlgD N-terminal domain-containing protein n=1 Tax=Sporohalobacter salinus TaxID=1494606 RepID=UPI0019607570|nr:flagellar hook capping FlgD N-terminal domain-containing protein [Sporohalobacter salinus]MBM7623518.1 flagellar basal-body rod modification protein FlgD [Sporohalobacter salinus]